MMEGESQVATLMEREQELQQEVARVAQNGKVARHEVQTMRDGLETLQAKGSAMPAKVQEQKQVLETERSQLEEATRGARPGRPAARAPLDGPTSPSRASRPDGCTRCACAECDKMEREQSYKLQQHANAIDFYSERLGLELENSGQTEPLARRQSTSVPDSGCWTGHGLCLIFTAIDPASPDAKHTLSMHVDDRGTYISAPRSLFLSSAPSLMCASPCVCCAVDSCTPNLANLDSCAAELNHSNEFGAFVQGVRGQFRCARLWFIYSGSHY